MYILSLQNTSGCILPVCRCSTFGWGHTATAYYNSSSKNKKRWGGTYRKPESKKKDEKASCNINYYMNKHISQSFIAEENVLKPAMCPVWVFKHYK